MQDKHPLRILRYGLGTDIGGLGIHRGGLNIVREYDVVGDGVHLNLWFERTVRPQWGLFGGRHGAIPNVMMNPGTGRERTLLKVNNLSLARGTRFRVHTGGGGGYGPPEERDPLRVREDILDGYVTREAANEEYRVVLGQGSLDVDCGKTAEARSMPSGL